MLTGRLTSSSLQFLAFYELYLLRLSLSFYFGLAHRTQDIQFTLATLLKKPTDQCNPHPHDSQDPVFQPSSLAMFNDHMVARKKDWYDVSNPGEFNYEEVPYGFKAIDVPGKPFTLLPALPPALHPC